MKQTALVVISFAICIFLDFNVSKASTPKFKPLPFQRSSCNYEFEEENTFSKSVNQNPKLTLIIIDSKTKQLIKAKVKVLDMSNKKSILGREINDTLKMDLVAGGNYRVISKADSHLFNEVEFDLSKQNLGSDIEITLELDPIKVGMKLELKEVYFETNSAKLMEESMEELSEVYQILWEHPNLSVQIAAHTDNTGTHDDNMELSGRRAQAVVEALKDKGVPDRMISAKGFGESKPLVANTTEENKRKNRRVEFIIVDVK